MSFSSNPRPVKVTHTVSQGNGNSGGSGWFLPSQSYQKSPSVDLCDVCGKRPKYVEWNGLVHPYCGRKCAQASKPSSNPPSKPTPSVHRVPSVPTQKGPPQGDLCEVCGKRPKFVESNGLVHPHCGRTCARASTPSSNYPNKSTFSGHHWPGGPTQKALSQEDLCEVCEKRPKFVEWNGLVRPYCGKTCERVGQPSCKYQPCNQPGKPTFNGYCGPGHARDAAQRNSDFPRQTYAQRAGNFLNAAAKQLLETMERKQSNLCVSVDVAKSSDLISVIDAVGPYVALIKTHIDVLDDFQPTVIDDLTSLSEEHDFLIFEDRKFSDIGNVISSQYSSGIYKIASWSHITSAHTVPGPSAVTSLASVGLPLGRGLLLLAEMSTKGSLAVGGYTKSSVRMALDHPDFVIGFIAQNRMDRDAAQLGYPGMDLLILTPGVGLDSRGDGKGQQYRTPKEVVEESGCDMIIVGRDIYGDGRDLDVADVRAKAERYQTEGWQAYKNRLAS